MVYFGRYIRLMQLPGSQLMAETVVLQTIWLGCGLYDYDSARHKMCPRYVGQGSCTLVSLKGRTTLTSLSNVRTGSSCQGECQPAIHPLLRLDCGHTRGVPPARSARCRYLVGYEQRLFTVLRHSRLSQFMQRLPRSWHPCHSGCFARFNNDFK